MGKQSTRRTDAAFSAAELAAFLAGDWVDCRSSNVASARYLADQQALEVGFQNGSYYLYPDVSPALAEQFALAPSKGGAVFDDFKSPGRPYTRYSFTD
jgi:hypothetical protein